MLHLYIGILCALHCCGYRLHLPQILISLHIPYHCMEMLPSNVCLAADSIVKINVGRLISNLESYSPPCLVENVYTVCYFSPCGNVCRAYCSGGDLLMSC